MRKTFEVINTSPQLFRPCLAQIHVEMEVKPHSYHPSNLPSIYGQLELKVLVTYRGIKKKHHWFSCVRVSGVEPLFHWVLSFKVHLDEAPISFPAITTTVVCMKSQHSEPAYCLPKVGVQ